MPTVQAAEMFPTNNFKDMFVPPVSPACNLLQLSQGWSTVCVTPFVHQHLTCLVLLHGEDVGMC